MTTPNVNQNEDDQAHLLNLPTPEYWDAASAAYEAAYSQNAGLLGALDRYVAHLPTGAEVLDLGSGTGVPVDRVLTGRGLRVHGVDASAAMVRRSRDLALPGATYEQADMRVWAPSSSSPRRFGGLVVSRSLFELPRADTEALAARWPAWLAPGAAVLLAMIGADDLPGVRPAMYDADGRFARDVPFRFMGDRVPCHVFTKAGWVALLEDHGFVVKDVWTDVFRPPEAVDSEDETDLFIIAQKPE